VGRSSPSSHAFSGELRAVSTWPRDHFQHDGAARIVAHDVERVLANIDADHGDRGIGCLRHGVLLVFGAPCQLRLLAGQEHGRTIPLSDINLSFEGWDLQSSQEL